MTTVTGPTSSTVGNIAFFDNTSGSSIGAAPAFQSGNPGNAAIYSTLANPANGYTTLYNGLQFSQGTPLPANRQFGVDAVGVQQAVVGTLSIASGDESVQGNAVAGYVETSQGVPSSGVGVFGQAATTVANASLFGANFIAGNVSGSDVHHHGLDVNFIACAEFDLNLWQTAGAVDPVANGGNAYGIWITGGGDIVGPYGTAIAVHFAGIINDAKWINGFATRAGAAINALSIGPAGVGSSQPSQHVVYQSVDAGGVARAAVTFSDQNGSYYIGPSANAAVVIEDGNGNVLIETQAGFGGSHVRLPALTSAGVVTNDASGVLSSSTTLPSGLTLPNPIIDFSGNTITLGASASGLIANNVACEIAIREASVTGELAKFLLGPFGVGKLVAQSGSDWSLGTSPPSTGFSIGFDSGTNTWKLYNGSGAARAYSFALTRFG